MGKANCFEELIIWQQARTLSRGIYKVSNRDKFNSDYALKNQIRRSVGSIMDNIAEGSGRGGNKEYIQYLYIAKGSLEEVRSQLYRALDVEYINQEEHYMLNNNAIDIRKGLINLIKYLKNSDFKGQKFKSSKDQ